MLFDLFKLVVRLETFQLRGFVYLDVFILFVEGNRFCLLNNALTAELIELLLQSKGLSRLVRKLLELLLRAH